MHKVAIIICNYNYEDYVVGSIDSALSQIFYENEVRLSVYFVDDGSSDGSWELVKKNFLFNNTISLITEPDRKYECFSSLINNDVGTYCYKIENSGASNARNFLINKAINNHDYICILDSDDMMDRYKIDTLLSLINKYDEIGVAYADYILNKPLYTTYEYKEDYSLAGLYRSCIVHSGSLIKSNYLKMVQLDNGEFYKTCLHGPASQGFIGSTEDYDLWFRLSKVCMLAHCPQPLTIVNEHGRNQSSKMTPQIFADNIRKMNV
jgi:glycosyltransferase involved in cell wall biosynthesis